MRVGDGRDGNRGHVVGEIVIHVARLIVTTTSHLAAIRGVLGETVNPVRRLNLRRVDADGVVVVGDDHEFLAPVAEEIAPHRRASAVGLMATTIFVVERIDATGGAAVGIKFVHDRCERPAARAIFEFARQIRVPPQRLGRPDVVGENLGALAIEDAGLGGIKFEAAMARVHFKGGTAAHVHDARRVPFFDQAAAAHINKRRREQRRIVLLDRKHFQAGPVRINVGDMEAIAVDEFSIKKCLAIRAVAGGTDFDQIINPVVVHVHDADLMSPRKIRPAGRCEEPAARQLTIAIIVGHRLALERAGGIAVLHVKQNARVDAVAIHDAEMSVHRAVGGPHVGDGRARQLRAGQPVENG